MSFCLFNLHINHQGTAYLSWLRNHIKKDLDADADASGLSRGKNFSVIEYLGTRMLQLEFFFFFLTRSSKSSFLLLSKETVRCELCILICPVVSVCIFYFSIEGAAFPWRNKYFQLTVLDWNKKASHCFLIHYLLIGFFNPDSSVAAPQRYCLGSYYFSLPAGSRWGPCILGLDLFTFLIISIVLNETGGLDLNPDHDSS